MQDLSHLPDKDQDKLQQQQTLTLWTLHYYVRTPQQ